MNTTRGSGEAIVRIDRYGSQPGVAVAGRITVDSSPRLRTALLELISKSKGRFFIDLSGVTHIDTSGLATLLEALNSAYEHSVRLRVAGMSGEPRRVAEFAQLDQIFRALGSEVEFR